ncbi:MULTISPECIES: hypothetical protein [Burkholderia]|uniref:hypothetical protein n=1 Tax=Burkholderia TaxID=32008 RepID=UPI001AD76696|nr:MULTISPECIES: hypothetical protein [Burkholderia]MBO7885736.1 hypothetical protein [Burkholderia pseudomallei]MBO7891644.1 hypothetical protein [Burkholderia pseudomallei]MBO7898856.1 hypothetical protein [Burkholderia pseudomallei]
MEKTQALALLRGLLGEITTSTGSAAFDRYTNLREVDAKVREAKHIFDAVDGLPQTFVEGMTANPDFDAQSRRVRLEALAGYIRSAVKFIESGSLAKPQKVVIAPPDVSRLTTTLPNLKDSIDRRWREAQKCIHVECFTSAVIMMGSILEALLLARANLAPAQAYQSPKAPRDRHGKVPAVQDWTLSSLIDVAVDLGWLKTDRGKFSHALRESRNVVHPWVEVTTRANFDLATCKTSWGVLEASVDDLMASLK